jgi:peptidoglycan-associated lipoprotein
MRTIGLAVLLVTLLGAAGCKKKTAPVPAPPTTTAAPTTAPPASNADNRPVLTGVPRVDSFLAEPARVERGQPISLRWATSSAANVSIDQGVGTVDATGARQLYPTGTTTYVLIARSGNQSDTRTVTVEVVEPRPISTVSQPGQIDNGPVGEQQLIAQLQDVLFDYNMSDFREDARRAINTDADILKRLFAQNPRLTMVIEGHADDRGSAEYNLGLADRRAIVTRDALVQLGVAANRLRTISYGEEAPVCREATEACWQRNRHVHFSPAQQ